MKINETARLIHMNAKAKGFWEEDNILEAMTAAFFTEEERKTVRNAFRAQKLALMTTEVAEAIEAERNNQHADLRYFEERMAQIEQSYSGVNCSQAQKDEDFKHVFKHSIKDTVEDELADTMIRIMDYAAHFNVDLERHIELKMRFNSLRPHKHGKKY
jgi:NTP pyrophosphatase (non-canonical NTP hydrolase)